MTKPLYILFWLGLITTLFVSPLALRCEPQEVIPIHIQEKQEAIKLVYPKDNSVIYAPSTFLVGCVTPQDNLTCNNSPVKINRDGFFAHVVNLQFGNNEFVLKDSQNSARILHVTRASNLVIFNHAAVQADKDSVEPKEDLCMPPGSEVLLSLRATPGSKVTSLFGQKRIELVSASNSHISANADFAYGTSTQNNPSNDPALYIALYRITAIDQFNKTPVKYLIENHNHKISIASTGTITLFNQPICGSTLHSDTIVRIGPGKARLTPLPEGVKLTIDGFVGEYARCRLTANHHVFILKKDINLDEKSIVAPNTMIRTVNINEDGDNTTVAVPLNQKLPFQIEQSLNPSKLVLRIFGATADTDWVTQSPKASDLLDYVSWKQPEDHIYELTVHLLGKRQWGYWATYEDNTLLLHIKCAPHSMSSDKPLSGLTICLDPGHGGSETGAIGPSGITESQINLAIALKLRNLLTADGAKIIMTRQTNSNYITLDARVQTAIKNNCDLLISIHNNALPDGRDPIAEHGTSSYWYHPQSLELARKLRLSLLHQINFVDFGTFYQNLALARPSNMPAVLVEVGFMVNPDEYSDLITDSFQDKVAKGLEEGIVSYFKESPNFAINK